MSDRTSSAIRLHLKNPEPNFRPKYQWLIIELTSSDRLIEPEDLVDLDFPPGIDTRGGVVISGRAPMWLYAYIVHELHPTSWVACYDPRLGAVVASTHTREVKIGQVIPLELPREQPQTSAASGLCPALMVVGPPDSGKSVLSHALFQALLPENHEVYLQRAQWDGEGNYLLELGSEFSDAEREAFKVANRGKLTKRFFPYHAQAILKLRRQKSLVIVDVGGMVQPEKLPLLEACTHYLIISSKPEAVNSWHEFCRDRGNLIPVAVIHSSLSAVETVHHYLPYLELTCGPWIHGQARPVPSVLLERVKSLVSNSNV